MSGSTHVEKARVRLCLPFEIIVTFGLSQLIQRALYLTQEDGSVIRLALPVIATPVWYTARLVAALLWSKATSNTGGAEELVIGVRKIHRCLDILMFALAVASLLAEPTTVLSRRVVSPDSAIPDVVHQNHHTRVLVFISSSITLGLIVLLFEHELPPISTSVAHFSKTMRLSIQHPSGRATPSS